MVKDIDRDLFWMVAEYFDGNVCKTFLWFDTKNPGLGDISPNEMIRHGRTENLAAFIKESLDV